MSVTDIQADLKLTLHFRRADDTAGLEDCDNGRIVLIHSDGEPELANFNKGRFISFESGHVIEDADEYAVIGHPKLKQPCIR